MKPVELYLWRIERYIRGKQAWFWQLKPYFNSFLCIWRPYGGQVSRKMVAKSLAACDSSQLHEENQLWFNNSKQFRFYWTKKHFIPEWYFTENHEIGSVVVRNVKKSWGSGQNRELELTSMEVEEQFFVADLFIMFIAWTSQKASKVHKRLSQSWP